MDNSEFTRHYYLENSYVDDMYTDLNQIIHMLDVITPKREYILNNIINTKKFGYDINSTYLAELTNMKQNGFTTIDDIINYVNDVNVFDVREFYVKLIMTVNSGYNLTKIN